LVHSIERIFNLDKLAAVELLDTMMVRVLGGDVYLGEKVVSEKEYLSAMVDYVRRTVVMTTGM
jgi:hypothetical protein